MRVIEPPLGDGANEVTHRFGRVLIGDGGPELPEDHHVSVVEVLLDRIGLRKLRAPDRRSALDRVEFLGVAGWEMRSSEDFKMAKARRPLDGEPWEMEEPPQPPVPPGPPDGGHAGAPGPPDTSAYLIGSVGVGVVFVSGPTPDLVLTEDHKVRVSAEIQEGLRRIPKHEPRANVSFTYDIKEATVTAVPDPSLVGYEPMEALWRDPALVSLGYPPGMAGVEEMTEALRAQLGTDWAYIAFFTLYPLHHFAYALKPHVVMNYNNGKWTPKNIDRVFQHETGHIFGAPDEYHRSNCNCNDLYGYLQERNGNCEACSGHFIECMMSHNTDDLCQFTPVHLGWRDSVGDGVLDPVRR